MNSAFAMSSGAGRTLSTKRPATAAVVVWPWRVSQGQTPGWWWSWFGIAPLCGVVVTAVLTRT